MWNLDGSTGGLGKVSLTNYGSYASSLRVAQNDQPALRPREVRDARSAGHARHLNVPGPSRAGRRFTAKATVRVPAEARTATGSPPPCSCPTAGPPARRSPASVERRAARRLGHVHLAGPGAVRRAAEGLRSSPQSWRATGSTEGGDNRDERIVGYVPPAPPAGTHAVSDLPFLSATNGWGPVERDTSVGEQAAGDGRPITIAGVTYAKGLGTNSVSDVAALPRRPLHPVHREVGVDDETGGAGTVTFSVVADGKRS